MRLLLTNDDGIHAPGITALAAALQEDGHQLWVVAPQAERSSCGHSMTFNKPIEVAQVDAQHWAVDWFPADCVLWAVNHLLVGQKIDALISGINQGGNMGQDLYCSGTVAAARQGMQLGIPSIAVSLDVSFAKLFKASRKKDPKAAVLSTKKTTAPQTFRHHRAAKSDHFGAVAAWMAAFLRHPLVASDFKDGFLNLNFPDCPRQQYKGIKLVRPGFIDYDLTITPCHPLRQKHFYWIGGDTCHPVLTPQTDVWAVKNKYIAASWVKLAAPLAEYGLTSSRTAKVWQEMFSSSITRK